MQLPSSVVQPQQHGTAPDAASVRLERSDIASRMLSRGRLTPCSVTPAAGEEGQEAEEGSKGSGGFA